MGYNPFQVSQIVSNLVGVSIIKPGFLGLNLQSNALDLNPGWALEINNAIIDNSGAASARKGWTKVNATPITGSPVIEQLHEYISASGTSIIISAANNKLFSGEATLTDITPGSPSWTGNLWKIQNFTNHAYFFQRSQPALRYDGTTVVGLTAVAGFLDSSDAIIGTLKPNECLSAYGRLWVTDTATEKMKIWWSDSLLGHIWSTGSAGSLDLRSVLTKGMDEIVALRAWNGFLIIFLKKHIVIYSGASIPSSMTLTDIIEGIGCIARDSIQEIGTDLLFLSDSGVRSLGRTIQEKSIPVGDISHNVKDYIIGTFNQADLSKVKSVYHENESFYILTLPTTNYTNVPILVFDLRRPLDDGTFRVTTWDSINPKALLSTRSRKLYLGQEGHIGLYNGYLDNGSSYIFSYFSVWMPLEHPNITKILKKLHARIEVPRTKTITFRWAFDYSNDFFTETDISESDVVAEYGIAEYGIAEYTAGGGIDDLHAAGSGTGEVIKFGISTQIAGFPVVIQKLDAMCKLGRQH